MKIGSVLSAFALSGAVLVGTSACVEEPCQGLSVTEQDKEAAANGYEVEKEDTAGNECQLSPDGTTWTVDD